MRKSDSIAFLGRQIRINTHMDYYDYKHDPNNIHPDDLPLVQHLVTEAIIPNTFSTWVRVVEATGSLVFPGYACATLDGGRQSDGSYIYAIGIEIPQADKYRYCIVRRSKRRYTLIADFVSENIPYVRS